MSGLQDAAATCFGPGGSSSDCYVKVYTKMLSSFKVVLFVLFEI